MSGMSRDRHQAVTRTVGWLLAAAALWLVAGIVGGLIALWVTS